MKKLKHTILEYLRQGLGRTEISMALAAGICLGIFPIYGPVTLLGLGLAWLARLNGPLLIAGIYVMTFVKPLLIIPFLKLGEWIFRAEPMAISLTELSRRFAEAPLQTLGEFGWSFLHATVGWLAVLPVAVPLIYFVCLPLVTRLDALRKREPVTSAVAA